MARYARIDCFWTWCCVLWQFFMVPPPRSRNEAADLNVYEWHYPFQQTQLQTRDESVPSHDKGPVTVRSRTGLQLLKSQLRERTRMHVEVNELVLLNSSTL